jgi:hypothetical protein
LPRTIVLSIVLPFMSALLGASLAMHFAAPNPVEAQDARLRAEQLSIVGSSGAERVQLQTGPGIAAGLYLLDENGGRRVQLSTGAPAGAGGGNPDAMGLTFNASDGSTALARIGSINTPDGAVAGMRLFLSDQQGNRRIDLSVDETGNPNIRLLDENGNATWSAQ